MSDITRVRTLGELKRLGYKSRSVKDELRENLTEAIRSKRPIFEGIYDYEETVLPQLYTAILARHNILLLGLRGQAKTRLARQLIELLDLYIPAIEGTELPEDPFNPITPEAIRLVEEAGDDLPIRWIPREERYTEKLATPDVSVADLLGDIDPIKAATLKLPYADSRVIHYGLIPRAHRGIFVINELPDLQPRIQVSLFNLLQERDVQIRGYKIRLPLDIQFVFTANPEDYTQRGTIVTPLKDRIGSQILTHYPRTLEASMRITQREASIPPPQRRNIHMPPPMARAVERIGFIARQNSELIDPKSGISARLTISAYECIMSWAEYRMYLNNESSTVVRPMDIYAAVPAITGKVELVYEGEKEGVQNVALYLCHRALKEEFLANFPSPDKFKRGGSQSNPYQPIIEWFAAGNELTLYRTMPDSLYQRELDRVPHLSRVAESIGVSEYAYSWMELVLHGLAEMSLIGRTLSDRMVSFKDLLGELLGQRREDDEEEED
ncbi:MAG: sigma 54-interacting transcriptional regulator [Bacteroidia bacterium]|nr:sigma 54-interacting transcriptional regulator [Bacteroidia bacterium]MDW8416667.1 sigma 54-interacting transcriptional regulator [Bacteroidia bacterium]